MLWNYYFVIRFRHLVEMRENILSCLVTEALIPLQCVAPVIRYLNF